MTTETTTVTVMAGAYASVRAAEKAKRVYGPEVTVGGILNSLNEPSWVYEVRTMKTP